MVTYYLLQEDGTSHILLEDSSGALVSEDYVASTQWVASGTVAGTSSVSGSVAAKFAASAGGGTPTAPTLDNLVAANYVASSSTASWTHTASAASTLFIFADVTNGSNASAPATCTVDGTSVTMDSNTSSGGFGQTVGYIAIFHTNVAAGSHTVNLSIPSPQPWIVASATFTGVSSVNIATATTGVEADAKTITIPFSTGDLSVAASVSGSSIAGANQTVLSTLNHDGGTGAGNFVLQSGTGTFSYTQNSDYFGYVGADMVGVSSGSGGVAAVSGVSGTAGQITAAHQYAASGTVAGVSSVIGTTMYNAIGIVAGTSTVSGNATRVPQLYFASGTVSGTSTVTAYPGQTLASIADGVGAWNAEENPAGTTLTTSNSTVNFVNGTVAYSNAQFNTGSQSYAFDGTSSTNNSIFFRPTGTAQDQISARFYLYLTGYPASTAQFMRFDPVTPNSEFNLRTTGAVQSLATSEITTAVLPLNQWVRVELELDYTAPTLTYSAYDNTNTLIHRIIANGVAFSGGQPTQLMVGKVTAVSMPTYYVDDVVVQTGGVNQFGQVSAYAVGGSVAGTSSASGAATVAAHQYTASGSVAGTSATTGSVTSYLPTLGTVSVTSADTGLVIIQYPIIGSTAGISSVSGNTTRVPILYSATGTVAGISSVTGVAGQIVAAVQWAASGTVAGISSVTGTTLSNTSGIVSGTSNAIGSVTSLLPTTGSTAGVSAVSGNATRVPVLYSAAGTIPATSTDSGNVTSHLPTSGSVAGTSAVSGNTQYNLVGTVAGTSSVAGAAVALLPTSGLVAGTSSVSGNTSAQEDAVSGSVAGTSSVIGYPGQILASVTNSSQYWNAEEQPSGTVMTTTTSGFTTVNGSWLYTNEQSNSGNNSYKSDGTTTGNSNVVAKIPSGTQDQFAARFYIYLTAYPSANVQFTRIDPISVATLTYLNTDGTVTHNASGTVATTPLPLNEWLRIETQVDYGAGMFVYTAYDQYSTIIQRFSIHTAMSAGQPYQIAFGKESTATYPSYYIDDVAVASGKINNFGPVGNYPLNGVVTGTSSTSGATGYYAAASGAVPATSSTSGSAGQIVAIHSYPCTGTVAGTSGVSGAVGPIYYAVGSVAAFSSVSGATTPTLYESGSVAAVSAVTGIPVPIHNTVGSVTADSTVVGTPIATHPVAGIVAATSGSSANPTDGDLYAVSGSTGGTSTVIGSVTPLHNAAGTVAAVSAVSGSVTGGSPITGTVASVSGVVAGQVLALFNLTDELVSASTNAAGSVDSALPVDGTVISISGNYGAPRVMGAPVGEVDASSDSSGTVLLFAAPSGVVEVDSNVLFTDPMLTGVVSGRVVAISRVAGLITGDITLQVIMGGVPVTPHAYVMRNGVEVPATLRLLKDGQEVQLTI